MRNLVRGLNEVGRAFGGTTDQVLSMTAAILSLESVPMRSGRDQAIGLGSAALTGAGFGASTGDPLLGGVSGAIGGNIIAGPAGAIVGGVTGIVSGLIEQGRRARLAAAQWEGFFADFEVMFLDMTPTEQRQHALEQTFRRGAQEAAAAFGGPASVDTIEEARALLETGVAGIPGVSEAYIEALERMVRRYDINSERLLGLTDSIDSLTSALNAPSGFRQSYYRWLAQGVIPVDDPRGLPPTGGGGGGGGGPDRRRGEVVYSGTMENHFHIQSTDPERAAEEIVRVWERQAIRGGPGPMEMTTR